MTICLFVAFTSKLLLLLNFFFCYNLIYGAPQNFNNNFLPNDNNNTNKNSTSSNKIHKLPDFCPLGEPLRSTAGQVVECNCPPHPFCPKLYYCKIAIQGQAGICCPDFGTDRRHNVKPHESRLPLNFEHSSSKNENCSISTDACRQLLLTSNEQNKDQPMEHDITNIDVVVSSGSGKKENMQQQRQKNINEKEAFRPTKKCKPLNLSDFPELPSANCEYVDVPKDEHGCFLPPKVVCPEPKRCPEISPPLVPPGCELGDAKIDENGCTMAPGIICKVTPNAASIPTRRPFSIGPILVPQAPASRPKLVEKVPKVKPKAPGYRSKFEKKIRRPITVGTRYFTAFSTTQPPSPPPCPIYPLPPTLSPDCIVAPPLKDARGCYLPPEIVCEKRPTAYADVIEENIPESASNQKISAVPIDTAPRKETYDCPEITIPVVQPGCKLLESRFDENGCRLMPEITCDPTIISKSDTLQCPPIMLPTMDPLCSFGPSRNDSFGCPMVPEIICPSLFDDFDDLTTTPRTVTLMPTKEPKIMSHCPYFPPPHLPPGCSYGVAKYDEHGCSISPDVICKEPELEDNRIEEDNSIITTTYNAAVATTSSATTTTTTVVTLRVLPVPITPPIPVQKEFKDMLTHEFYHIRQSNETPQAVEFRVSRAIPMLTAGRFHGCRVHADCFHFREPREWCDTGHPESEAVWTDKSCHCADDTIVRTCIVERLNRGVLEWTFCADYSQCAINH